MSNHHYLCDLPGFMHPKELSIAGFSYHHPHERIAQQPLPQRDQSKLLVYKNEAIEETVFSAITGHLPANSTIIFNDTKVIHARILFKNENDASIEVFLLEPIEPFHDMQLAMFQHGSCVWKCLVGNVKKWREQNLSKKFIIDKQEGILEVHNSGKAGDDFLIHFSWSPQEFSFARILDAAGYVPLPPYIKRYAAVDDERRYQTMYAYQDGSAAAPTAGLHFSENVFESLKAKHIRPLLQIVSNFNNMRGANIFPKNNAAIRATSAYDCNDRTLTVGGNFANNVDRCTFVNSGFGIYTAGEMNVDVQNNIFGTAAVAGSGNTTGDIFISLPGLKNVNITSNNWFYQFNHAVQINTSPQYATNIFIDNNIFDTYRPVSEDQYFGTAVLVINKGASVQKPKRNFTITNNTIINPRIGIAVLNHNYIHIGFDPVNNITSANTIQYNLTTAPGDYTAGMLLQNCGNARVVGNTISNSNTAHRHYKL